MSKLEILDAKLSNGEQVKMFTKNPKWGDEQDRYINVMEKVEEGKYKADFHIEDLSGVHDVSGDIISDFYSFSKVLPSLF